MTRAFYFIVFDIVFHIERKINYFILFILFYLYHNVRVCMGLLIHKTSLFLAFVDKFLRKNEGGGGCFVPFSMLNLFDIDRGFLFPLYIPIF
jgi:hypothetical protein